MHWLSYSNSDQSLLRNPDLESCWDALLVPGTLAAYYFQGTGGFVLSRGRPYAIDPRTPLLQELPSPRPAPRASHLELARIHDPDTVDAWPAQEIGLAHWEDGRWPTVVENVLDFQQQYATSASEKVGKYEALLAEARGQAPDGETTLQSPFRFIPPYWAVAGIRDSWWGLSRDAIALARDRIAPEALQPIVCLREAAPLSGFGELFQEIPAGVLQVFAWKSQWDETEATQEDIDAWVYVIEAADKKGVRLSNLYGGYLSVLLTGLGLDGLNHGVGYSEKRDARRLGATGAPPARYYVPALRRFLAVPTAQAVVAHLPGQWSCTCSVCEGGAGPADLSSERLKRHFLLCRAAELTRVDAAITAELDDVREVARWLTSHPMPGVRLDAMAQTLRTWASGIDRHL